MNTFLFWCVYAYVLVSNGNSQLIFDKTCGVSRGCFHNCDDYGCDFIITWKHIAWLDVVEFTMAIKLKDAHDPQWFAIGFSDDKLMGSDSVIECVSDATSRVWADVKHSYNEHNYNVDISHPKYGLRAMSGTRNDGVLSCNFTRLLKVVDDDKIFDLDKPWYIFATSGIMKYGVKLGHDVYPNGPCVSTEQVDVREILDIYDDRNNYLVKVHGSLMIVSWMFLASLSIILARYYKQQWPEGRACGRRVWYQAHKVIMLTVLVCVSVSFILIWFHTKGLPKLRGTNSIQKAHPTLGIVVMGLTLLNPIMAFLRPSNGTANRPVFKYVHGFIGTSVYVLAILNIILGITLPQTAALSYTIWIIVAFGVYVVLFEIIMETHECYLIRTGRKSDHEIAEMSVMRNSLTKMPQPPGSLLKNILFSLHIIIVTGFTISSVYLIVA